MNITSSMFFFLKNNSFKTKMLFSILYIYIVPYKKRLFLQENKKGIFVKSRPKIDERVGFQNLGFQKVI